MGEKNEQDIVLHDVKTGAEIKLQIEDVTTKLDDQTEQVKRLAYLVGRSIGQAENRWKQIWPDRVLISGNRTIVFWADGAKTIVKRADDETDSVYSAYTAALAIKMYGSNSAVKRIIAERLEVQVPTRKKPEDQSRAT